MKDTSVSLFRQVSDLIPKRKFEELAGRKIRPAVDLSHNCEHRDDVRG